MNPLVTIITPTYNRGAFLRETVESILSQAYSPLEYIVINDGSTDDTLEILAPYTGRIRIYSHDNIGENPTVNRGFELANGDLICVVNSDDPLLPGAVEEAVSALKDNPDAVVAYPDWNIIGPDSEVIGTNTLPECDVTTILRTFNCGLGPGAFIRRSALDVTGPRDTQYKYAGDAELWLRLALVGRLHHIPRILATHREHPDSLSVADRGPKITVELKRMVDKTFDHPDLPANLLRDRDIVYAIAHRGLAKYCEQQPWNRLIHLALGAGYAFRFYTLHELRKQRRRLALAPIKLCLVIGRMAIDIVSAVSGDGPASRSQKFAIVSYYLPPMWSGGAVVLGRILGGIDPGKYCLVSRFDHAAADSVDFIIRLPAPYHHVPGAMFMPGSASRIVDWLHAGVQIVTRAWKIARVLKKEGVEAVVVTTGDLVELPAAFVAARLCGVRYYAYLFDDFISQWWNIDRALEMATRLEGLVLRRANGIIAPNEFMVQEIQTRYGRDAAIVRNPCADEIRSKPDKGFGKNYRAPIEIVFTGAVYHVNLDAIELLIEAIERIDDIDFRLVLYTAQQEALKAQGIDGEKVAIRGHMPPAEIAEVHANADVLLIPFTFDERAATLIRTSATGKLADYLASGRPVLSGSRRQLRGRLLAEAWLWVRG